jgi:SagB-type dehydrogenase family enzyme
MHPNPHVFFFLKEGELIAWDYQNHQQFSIEPKYLQRLLSWSKQQNLEQSSIDHELAEGKLLSNQPIAMGEWGWDILSQIYHLGTKDIAENFMNLSKEDYIQNYLDYCQTIAAELPKTHTQHNGDKIKLPSANFSLFKDVNFFNVLKQRKTCRSFNGKPITLDQLSTLLFTSLGPLHGDWEDLKENDLMPLGIRKAFPSGGGLHPEEAYIFALRVEGLEPGIYHYRFSEHELTLIEKGHFEDKLVSLLSSQYFVKGIGVGIFLTARFDRTWWKYPHSKGYRVVLFDIGHASQTVLLTSTALGLNTWITGAFADSQVEKMLKIYATTESPLLFVGAGYGDNRSIDEEMIGRLKTRECKPK